MTAVTYHESPACSRPRRTNVPLFNRLALTAIDAYRKHLSPWRSYFSPKRVLTGTAGYRAVRCACGAMGCPTCSTAGRYFFERYPLRKAYNLQKAYLERCAEMAAIHTIASSFAPEDAIPAIAAKFGKSRHEAKRHVDNYHEQKRKDEDNRRRSRCDGCDPPPVIFCVDPCPGPVDNVACDVAPCAP